MHAELVNFAVLALENWIQSVKSSSLEPLFGPLLRVKNALSATLNSSVFESFQKVLTIQK